MMSGKILNIMTDEKFLDYFIDQSETINSGNVDYWVLIKEKNQALKYIKSDKVKHTLWQKETVPVFLEEAKEYDLIIFHSLFFDYLNEFLLALPLNIKIAWIFWGGDGYKYDYNYNRLILPATKYEINKAVSLVDKIKQALINAKQMQRRKKDRAKTIKYFKRINYCLTWVKGDFYLINEFNPEMQWLTYNYFTAEQQFSHLPEISTEIKEHIWIGNSSTPTNNHIDAFKYLKNIRWNTKVYCPLSYGEEWYKQIVIKKGTEYFGDKFVPLVDFLPLNEYQMIMNECGFVWMNHLRQQAAGNVLQAVYLGKKVILNKENTLYSTLKEWGVDIFDSTMLNNIHSVTIDTEQNRKVLNQKLSFDEILKSVSYLYAQAGK